MSPVRNTSLPSSEETYQALRVAADALGRPVCWLWQGRYHFVIADAATVAIVPEHGGRFAVSAGRSSHHGRPVWVLAADHPRLAAVVAQLADELALPV